VYLVNILSIIKLCFDRAEQLLVEHELAVAPDPTDILHELLDDLGEVLEADVLMMGTTFYISLNIDLKRERNRF